jgi:Flp pilus assembly protein TadG
VRKRINRFRGEEGQALVELAFVIPIVLLFLFAIIDFGLALNQQNGDTNIANIAVREAAVVGTTTTSATCGGVSKTTLTDWAECESTTIGGPSLTGVCVKDIGGATSTTFAAADAVEVKVTSSFSWVRLITGQVGNLSSTIGASATMRMEQAATGNTFLTNSTICS